MLRVHPLCDPPRGASASGFLPRQVPGRSWLDGAAAALDENAGPSAGKGAKVHQQVTGGGAPVVVTLPAEVDVTNADQVYDRLEAATGTGAFVVIADCTNTTFCDAAGVRRLVRFHARAAARGIQFRLVTAPGGLLCRLLELVGAQGILPVYRSTGEAGAPPVPRLLRDPLSCPPPGRQNGPP